MKNLYLDQYNDFVVSLHQTSVIAKLASTLLEEFPNNLPTKVAQPYNDTLTSLMERIVELEEKGGDTKFGLHIEYNESNLSPFIFLVLTHLQSNPESPIDFKQAITSQNLIMIYARLDAFMADSMRIICATEPRVMICQKNLSWESIIKSKNWEDLIGGLIDEFVSDFVQPTVASRIEYLNKRIGLDLQFSDDEVQLLEEAENLRHAFVHNGGKVDKQLMKRIGRDDLVLGSEIFVDDDYMEAVFRSAMNFGAALFTSVLKKFLKHNFEDEPLPIWTTGVNIE